MKTETWSSEDGKTVLWGAEVGCEHEIQLANGGGIKCVKCGGWFCL